MEKIFISYSRKDSDFVLNLVEDLEKNGNALFCNNYEEYSNKYSQMTKRHNEVKITVHADAIHIGSLFQKNSEGLIELCQLIAHGGIPCEITNDIEKDLWAKMLYNCALNGLGAILNVPYGVLGEYDHTRTIMQGIIEEIYFVMDKAGYRTHWVSATAYGDAFYARLLPPTAQHESSTLQDIRARKRTEIDALNGAIIHLAEKSEISIPHNRLIYNMIKFIEARNLNKT